MPVASRMRWVLRQIHHGRAPHIAIGPSLKDPNIVTVRVTLQSVHRSCCSDMVREFAIKQLNMIFNVASDMHAADRGHQLSDGSSVIRFWLYPDRDSCYRSFDGIAAVDEQDVLVHNSSASSLRNCEELPIPPPPQLEQSDFGLHDPFGSPMALLAASQQQLASMVTTFNEVQEKLHNIHNDVTVVARDVSDLARHASLPDVGGVSMLDASADDIADMCMSIPVDVGTQCSIVIDTLSAPFQLQSMRTFGSQTDSVRVSTSSAQTRVQHVAHRHTQTDLFAISSVNASFDVDIGSDAMSSISVAGSDCERQVLLQHRCPADVPSDDSDSDGLEHNVQMVRHSWAEIHDDLFGHYWRTETGEELEITSVYFDNDLEQYLYELDWDATRLHPREYFTHDRFPDVE